QIIESDVFKSKMEKLIRTILDTEWVDELRLNKLNDVLKLERARKASSPNPWFEVNPDSSPADSISTRFAWNQAFIESLKEQGIAGKTDEELIGNWQISQANIQLKIAKEKEIDDKMNSDEPW